MSIHRQTEIKEKEYALALRNIAKGDISGKTVLHKFGSNADIGTSYESIWTEGGLYNWAGVDAAAGIVKLSSASTNDNGTGVKQVETITCTAGESTGAGNITMTITSAGMGNSPKAVVVAVGLADGVNDVGLALRTALGVDADVSAFFTVSGADASAILTAITPAADDATLAFGFVDTDSTGVTFGASTNTTAGEALGTGARTATIYGLTAAGAEQNETITLNGQTAVNSTNEYKRVNRIIVITAGSGLVNAGIVYVGTGSITTGKPAVVWALVDAGINQTLMAIYTVPTGKTLYITTMEISTNSNKGAVIDMFFRPSGELFQIKHRVYNFSDYVNEHFDLPLVVTAGTDIDFRAVATAATGAYAVTFDGWLE